MPYAQLKTVSSSKPTTPTGAPSYRNAGLNIVIELLLVLLLVAFVLAPIGIGLLHTSLCALALGSSLFASLVLPLAATLLGGFVTIHKNPVHSLLALIGVFVSTVLMFIFFGSEFLAYVFLIVYVGAVAILFLFVVMLLRVKSLSARDVLVRGAQYVAIAIGVFLFWHLLFALTPGYAALTLNQLPAVPELAPGSLSAFRAAVDQHNDILHFSTLYTVDDAALFSVSAVILLTAMLAAIILAAKAMEGKKHLTADMVVSPDALVAAAGRSSVFTSAAALPKTVQRSDPVVIALVVCALALVYTVNLFCPLDLPMTYEGALAACRALHQAELTRADLASSFQIAFDATLHTYTRAQRVDFANTYSYGKTFLDDGLLKSAGSEFYCCIVAIPEDFREVLLTHHKLADFEAQTVEPARKAAAAALKGLKETSGIFYVYDASKDCLVATFK